jgi:hypothetical protein
MTDTTEALPGTKTARPDGHDGTNGDSVVLGTNGTNGSSGDGRSATTERRTELADFLRSRRERIQPEDVGFAPGMRRRTPGLRREEVAQLAGVGVTWYTWLEQGRPINVSSQVLDAVARALHLDKAERAHLHRLADLCPVPLGDDARDLPAEIPTILDGLDPLPAAIYNGRYDVLAWNRTYAALFPGLVRLPPEERNVLWCLFTSPDCCNQFVNRATELPAMVATVRGAFARHVGEPAWSEFVRRLSAASPEFAAMWATHDVAGARQFHKVYRHAAIGDVRFTATALTPALAPHTRMSVLTPQDDDTRAKVAWLVDHPDAPACPRHPLTGVDPVTTTPSDD